MQQHGGEEGLGVEVCGRSDSSLAAGGFLPPLWVRTRQVGGVRILFMGG
jgi:hypothetical protein